VSRPKADPERRASSRAATRRGPLTGPSSFAGRQSAGPDRPARDRARPKGGSRTVEEPRFFPSQAAFRAWLAEHHATAKELVVGFYKASSGKGGLLYRQAVNEALCFGWIDGVVHRLDDARYTHRFSPRAARSTWSAANVRRVAELEAAGLMAPAGLAAFRGRDPEREAIYAFEKQRSFTPDMARRLRADRRAWAFWEKLPPGVRRVTESWVNAAKREETRERRFALLVEHARRGERIPALTSPARRPK
jgi:uncharacterized protein YdeI (YjbR/CyaY-like superfamily)